MIGNSFYSSADWLALRQIIINDRLTSDGMTICEHCHQPIVRAYDTILHHIIELTEDNVNDANVALNPDNIMVVHHRCHNVIHNKLGYADRRVYVVYGPPLAGKTSYVHDCASEGDLIVDIDNIWECISGCERYAKPPRLNANVFGIRDLLLQQVERRVGKWQNAYIIGGYPLISERERLIKRLGAIDILIDTPKEICLSRLPERNLGDWEKYIDDWFDKFTKK